MTQEELIQDYLERGHSITPIDALNKFGCFRLGARIWDLRQKGLDIKREMVWVKKNTQVARYSINDAA